MKVFVANFGEQNYAWPECLRRGTIATMNTVEAQPFWAAGDREGYIRNRMGTLTAAGNVPTRAVASRWFNLMTNITESSGDIWLHSDADHLWWTESLPGSPVFEELDEPIGRRRKVVICHKQCEPWSNKSVKGNPLPWAGLHPKSKDFLATEATMQQLGADYAAYALALIRGEDLAPWHDRSEWKAKIEQSKSKAGAVVVFNDEQKAAWRMARTALQTVAQANGQTVERNLKVKDLGFTSEEALRVYIETLIADQDRHCALTGLPINFNETDGDPEMRASLDRIDSNGHYEPGNLQIVCKFANRWKGADDNAEFRRLVESLKDFS
ncbi:hypothetical protein [Pseudooceanicola sp. LIPI14-2-Ac024]|uniref:hypothetical protein n=1 Tax=Pseudooceanicola sp. LIPI14-2-Ac024 TaxID=3344875 RepID=UPI0035D01DFA